MVNYYILRQKSQVKISSPGLIFKPMPIWTIVVYYSNRGLTVILPLSLHILSDGFSWTSEITGTQGFFYKAIVERDSGSHSNVKGAIENTVYSSLVSAIICQDREEIS
jgi:hypothetical protein